MYQFLLSVFVFTFSVFVSVKSYSAEYVDVDAGTDIDFSEVENLIDKNKPKTIEDFITYLPESYKANYNIQKEGRGLQEASFEFPRIIVYGETAKTVMTFNGHPSQKQYNEIELMSYDDIIKEYQFRVISFQSGKAVMSEKNPAVCMRCHKDSRPLWDTYSDWKGMYGEHNDRMTLEELAHLRSDSYKGNSRYSKLPEHKVLSTPPLDHLRPRFNAQMGIFLKYRWAVSIAEKIKKSGVLGKIPDEAVFGTLVCNSGRLDTKLTIAKSAHPADFDQFMSLYNLAPDNLKVEYVNSFILLGRSFFESKRSVDSIIPDTPFGRSHTGIHTVAEVILANLAPFLPNIGEAIKPDIVTYCQQTGYCSNPAKLTRSDRITKFITESAVGKYCSKW
ncbi:MAG: hypothetical protein V4654_02920 [Bdellovibrionota bacterium]